MTIYGNLGNLYETREKLSQAEEMYQKALELNQALGRKQGIANISFNLGLLYKAQHRYPAAKAVFEQSRQNYSGYLSPTTLKRLQDIENQLLEIQSTQQLMKQQQARPEARRRNRGTVDKGIKGQ